MSSGSVKGIEIHDRREKDGISHTNKDIDWERSNQNYDLHPAQNENFNRAVKDRISQLNLPRAVRKDAVVMAQCLVTSDRGFFDHLSPSRTKEFFKDSYEFLANRYGRENIVSSTVHMDEKTPHMHFNFVPVTADGRLSAKTILNRADLIKQQDDFFRDVGQKYGLARGERGGIKVHLETAELKKVTLESEVQTLISEKNALQREIQGLQGKLKLVRDVEAVPVKKSLLGGKIEVSEKDWNLVKEAARKSTPLALENMELKERNAKLEGYLTQSQGKKSFEVSRLEADKKVLQNEIKKLKEYIAHPELVQAQEMARKLRQGLDI